MSNIFYSNENRKVPDNLIREFFSDELLKALYYHACRVDIPDNNDKAEMIKMMLPSNEFDELGTGTNRITFLKDGFAVKIALDRRGLTDNHSEFKRSSELPMYLAKTYESNYLINISEYVGVLDQAQFLANEETIKYILEDISKGYLFDDVGFTLKNSYNWGFRESIIDPGEFELVILDYGYLYPLLGQNQNELFRCPKCNGKMRWDVNYTHFRCNSAQCNYKMTPVEMRRRMKLDMEDLENQMNAQINNLGVPNLRDIEQTISNI